MLLYILVLGFDCINVSLDFLFLPQISLILIMDIAKTTRCNWKIRGDGIALAAAREIGQRLFYGMQ